MIRPRQLRQKNAAVSSLHRKKDMETRTTYRLLVQSEDRNRNIMEVVVYGLVALSVIVSIWQFAEQPLQTTAVKVGQAEPAVQIAS